ncbi:MAG: hypothetical protein B7O98_04745 [Zestosphaera tikiterensis]|uniref:Uncharacterized protein n=1 Tax=Zestosphaera tikiterensis TaxID=1973259 RepID=A0A2R7Y7B7_9CREN|nr:MAG: hypothetical protein B7O98_04745 [Zestosphaera tikiterensis]
MGRRSRKRYKRFKPVQRTLPKVFQCPACGMMTLIIDLESYENELGEERKHALVKCMNPKCGLRAELSDLPSIYEVVDTYSKFLDKYSKGELTIWFEKGEQIE